MSKSWSDAATEHTFTTEKVNGETCEICGETMGSDKVNIRKLHPLQMETIMSAMEWFVSLWSLLQSTVNIIYVNIDWNQSRHSEKYKKQHIWNFFVGQHNPLCRRCIPPWFDFARLEKWWHRWRSWMWNKCKVQSNQLDITLLQSTSHRKFILLHAHGKPYLTTWDNTQCDCIRHRMTNCPLQLWCYRCHLAHATLLQNKLMAW